jgi:hypothetical protein
MAAATGASGAVAGASLGTMRLRGRGAGVEALFAGLVSAASATGTGCVGATAVTLFAGFLGAAAEGLREGAGGGDPPVATGVSSAGARDGEVAGFARASRGAAAFRVRGARGGGGAAGSGTSCGGAIGFGEAGRRGNSCGTRYVNVVL